MGVPNWKAEGRLMHFGWLDASGSRVPAFTVGWRIEDQPNDPWSQRFIQFKNGHPLGFMGGAFVMKEAVAELLRTRSLNPVETSLTTALSSKNTEADPNSVLYRTGAWVAENLGLTWLPNAFSKQSHRSLKTIFGASERDAEVNGKYVCNNVQSKNLIILDDFITRGATLGDMERALRQQGNKVNLFAIALAKHERAGYAAGYGVSVSNAHIPTEWDQVWIDAGQHADKK